MRRSDVFGLLLVSLVLLGLVAVAGCGETTTPSTATGGSLTTASDATPTTNAVENPGETTAATGTVTTTSGSATPPTSGSTPTSGATPPSAPDSGTTLTSSGGLPAGITLEEIRSAMESIGMVSPSRLQIYDYENFGHYAAAYVMAADENVYLVLLNDETGGWAILATYTGLDWETVQADLRAKAAPEDLIEWANPGEG